MSRRGPIICPKCGSGHVKPVHARTLRERFLKLVADDCARWSSCGHRFMATPTGNLGNVTFARCPRCLRMDLGTWDPKYYRPSLWMEFKVWFGANRWRCEPCRTNFVSFRPRKEKYVRPGADPNQDDDLLPI